MANLRKYRADKYDVRRYLWKGKIGRPKMKIRIICTKAKYYRWYF